VEKSNYPSSILKRHLSVAECWPRPTNAVAPMVSIAGGKPLLHPEIAAVAKALVSGGGTVYL